MLTLRWALSNGEKKAGYWGTEPSFGGLFFGFFGFGRFVGGADFVDEGFDEAFFHVDVEAQQADEGKKLQELLIFFGGVCEGCFCGLVAAQEVFFQALDLALFHAENLIINPRQIQVGVGAEIFFRQGIQKRLDVADG